MTTNWEEGGKVYFLAPSEFAICKIIFKNEPNSKMFYTHIGDIVNFEELSNDEKTTLWNGANENYLLLKKMG